MRPVFALLVCICAGAALGCAQAPDPAGVPAAATVTAVKALRPTASLPFDPDDPAIWLNRTDPSKSLVIGTVKVAAPNGGLAVFSLDGHLKQMVTGPDRPNNVDVEYGLDLDGTPTDIAVLTERFGRRMRVYQIAGDGGGLKDISSGTMPILLGAEADAGAPMGIALYRRPKDGVIFAIVSPKSGPTDNYLWQYRLEDDSTGRVKATFVRRFGKFHGTKEIEAVAVDDALGYVYYADEDTGIHKYAADPDAPNANAELALFAIDGYAQDREGVGIYAFPDGTGYIVCVDQRLGESVFHLYKREGEPGRPNNHTKTVFSFTAGADGTDGLDVTSASLGPEFPGGVMVAMNSASHNFLLVRWADIAKAATPPLRVR